MRLLTTFTRMWLTRSTKPFLFRKEYDCRLPFEDCDKLGLYVHIPFCKKICGFCPYCKTLYSQELCNQYLDALLQEIHLVGRQYHGKKRATSLYFGGGTPALAAERLHEIVEAIQEHFILSEGIGVELHPDNVTPSTLRELKEAGVTKISIGIQSFQEKFQRMLGRTNELDVSVLGQTLSKIPFETVSMDFIFALPTQTFADLKADLDTAFQNGANHVAIYPFIDFSFTPSSVQAMPHREKKALLETITRYCMEQGYSDVSFWLYVENAAGSSRNELQIRLLPDGEKYSPQDIATNQWVEVKIALSALVDQMNESTGQVKLLWVTAPASSDNPISAVWMTGLIFENPGRIDIVDFSSDATASFDASTSGDMPNVSASWVTQDNLPGENDKPSNGAVKLTLESGKDANVRVLSTIDKELYRSGYRAKILVYFEKADGRDVAYSKVHNGYVQDDSFTAAVNTWVTIEVPAYQDGNQNDLYDVNAWFAGGYTGWLKIAADQNVTAVYVAGVWLESPTQA